jgi:hypothetical protein
MTSWLLSTERNKLFKEVVTDFEKDISAIEDCLIKSLDKTYPDVMLTDENISTFCDRFSVVQTNCIEWVIEQLELPKTIIEDNFEEHVDCIEKLHEIFCKNSPYEGSQECKDSLVRLATRLENVFKKYAAFSSEIAETIDAIELSLSKTSIVTKLFDEPKSQISSRFPFSVVNLLDPSLQASIEISTESDLSRIVSVYKRYIDRLYYFKHCVEIDHETRSIPTKLRSFFA